LNRRSFLTVGALGAVAAALAPQAAQAAGDFSFVHFTDIHIQPELHAAAGSRRCIAKINALKPDFAICGGDLVFDACAVTAPRAKQVFVKLNRSRHGPSTRTRCCSPMKRPL